MKEALPVNPWGTQRNLMTISAQALPDAPTIHNGSILYGALIAEEAGETLEALGQALDAIYKPMDLDSTEDDARHAVALSLVSLGRIMQSEALKIRTGLKACGDVDIKLTPEQAVDIFDGTTDITVVNCGFAESMGLPGLQGYMEVALSNHSKANPDTGVIDKDPSGKWIKGKNFKMPDLLGVLKAHLSIVQGSKER